MSRTLRNLPKYWCRVAPHTQQERRLYHATLDQEMPVHVRAHRRPNHLPDSWAELHASSYTQFVCITRWLWKQVGKPWDEVFKAAGTPEEAAAFRFALPVIGLAEWP